MYQLVVYLLHNFIVSYFCFTGSLLYLRIFESCILEKQLWSFDIFLVSNKHVIIKLWHIVQILNIEN
ncbi:hypothetical protein U750_11660 [Streptococcus pseudopneumoniae G42]|nr:hypothetical protein U750_11660 [Streptococcus pseudopneumoniae G42]